MSARLRRPGGVIAIIGLFVCGFGVSLWFFSEARDAESGSALHYIAQTVFPEHAGWSDRKFQEQGAEKASADRKLYLERSASVRRTAGEDPYWLGTLPITGCHIWLIDHDSLSPGNGYMPVESVPCDISDEQVRAAVRQFVEARVPSPLRMSLPPPTESWTVSLVLAGSFGSATVLWGFVLAGRRPSNVELALTSRLLPRERRDGWCAFVREVADATPDARVRRTQMRSIAFAFPSTTVAMWCSRLSRLGFVPRNDR